MLGKDETIALLWLHHLTCTSNMLVTKDCGSEGRLIVEISFVNQDCSGICDSLSLVKHSSRRRTIEEITSEINQIINLNWYKSKPTSSK